MKVLTFSRAFPANHPRAGQPTWFVEKIFAHLTDKDKRGDFQFPKDFILYDWHEYYSCSMLKSHTIRSGNRWVRGDWASLRVWSGRPYASKQVEFAKVQVMRAWPIEIKPLDLRDTGIFIMGELAGIFHPNNPLLQKLAKNDGLEPEDFISWFSIHPKKKKEGFSGQIICWDDSIEY